MTQWQGAFHDVYDRCPPKENDGPRPDALGDLSCDFRLLIGFGWLTPAAQEACLAHLPGGAAMQGCVRDWLSPGRPIPAAEAQQMLARAVAGLGAALNLPDWRGDALWDELGACLPQRAARTGGVRAEAAVLFLGELMYWQGSTYIGAHYVGWSVAEPDRPNPVAPFVALYRGGWQVMPEGADLTLVEISRNG